ncbi:hypothetical protein J4E90_007404 [Alternaria incomplexa]|uniref:uncharacterized protein n=1 Tax=Alternaria incomplexa TaxID=1187928 RepID=UPI00221FB689|nr:uncharacterized protein J4E90_007404 [Alternaria incomplexa]KAI4911146.1 hypothetical protein J4E90_007404 [Alternaria incomplexa]
MNVTIPDPLTVLPPEIVLRILDFTPVSALGSLTAVSPAWHQFIDGTHQEAIYSSPTKTSQPHKTSQPAGGARDFSFVNDYTSFSKLFDGITSWKDLCKRQTLLERNWNSQQPTTRESILQVGNHAVWRFKADFKRRIFISTSHAGGLYVSDMDTGRILWQLPSALDTTEDHAVRPYAHLEYQDGMAAFDREGDAVEVWRTDQEGTARGEFQRVAVLDHDCQTRGFQLSYWTLVVVSVEGQGFVYDMKQNPPKLITHLEIEQDAVGHLDQNEDVVVYSMGTRGYHVYEKKSGQALGILQPSQCTEEYHVEPLPPTDPPSSNAALAALRYGRPSRRIFPPSAPRKSRLTPIHLGRGPLPNASRDPNEEDEWGAGMLDRSSNLFVGFSRLGRVFVCSDLRKALEDGSKNLASVSQILECESDGSTFDLGGWLSARNHRIMFEIQNRVYVVALNEDNRIIVGDEAEEVGPSYSFLTSSAPQLAVPVSFMALFDDAIMTTYAVRLPLQAQEYAMANRQQTLGQRREEGGNGRIFPTKAIRIISLAPSLDNGDNATTEVEDPILANLSQHIERPQDELLRLLLMFDEEPSDDDDVTGLEDEWVDEDDATN